MVARSLDRGKVTRSRGRRSRGRVVARSWGREVASSRGQVVRMRE